MNINIKEHLKQEIIIIFIVGIFMSATNIHIFIFFVGTFSIVGLYNTLYLFVQILKNKKNNVSISILIFLITFGIQWVLFSIVAIPLIICESIMVSLDNVYIGSDARLLNQKYKENQNPKFVNQKENSLYYQFLNQYKRVTLLKIIMIIIFCIYIVLISRLIINNYIINIISLFIIVIFWLLYIIIKVQIINKANIIIYNILVNECDSKTCYHIYKALHAKIPNDYTILQYYFMILRIDENDFSELKKAIEENKQYNKHNFYLRAMVDTANDNNKKESFNKMYTKLMAYNNKMYKKTKAKDWKNNIIFLNIDCLEFEDKYKEMLELCQTIEDDGTKISEVKKAFIAANCLVKLNRVEEAKKEYEYVIKYGNTLRICNDAKKYLKTL